MKRFIIAIVVLMFAAPAFAAPQFQGESWTATGMKAVKSSTRANAAAGDVEFKIEGFESESLCQQAITTAAAQPTEKHVVFTLYATCVEVRTQQN